VKVSGILTYDFKEQQWIEQPHRSKIIDGKWSSTRSVAREFSRAFKARKNVRKTFLVALATPELLLPPQLTRPERNVRRFYPRSNPRLNSVRRYVETSGLTVSSASLRQLLNSQFFHNNSLNMFHELIEVLVTGIGRSLDRR